MKICKNCDSENIDSGRFCIECGQRFEFISPVSPATPSYGYDINTPATDNTRPSSSSQYPPQTNRRQEYPTTEEFSNIRASNGLKIFSKASFLFTLITIVIFVNRQFNPGIGLDLILMSTGVLPLPIFTYGLYSFVNETPTKFKEQGSVIVKLLAVYCVLASIYFLICLFFIPEVPIGISLSDWAVIAISMTPIILIGFISEVIFLLGSIKFTAWFNEIILRVGINNSTTKFKWIGILKITFIGSFVLALLFLSTYSGGPISELTLLFSSLFFLIGAITLLAGSIMQILAGYKIYKILKQLQNLH